MTFTGRSLLQVAEALLALSLLLGQSISAQVAKGSISGVAEDSSGAAVPSASVTLTDIRTTFSRTAKTDSGGNFSFPQLEPGEYKLAVSAPRFATWENTNIRVHVAQNVTVNAKLDIARAITEVTVTSSDVAVNTESAEISDLVSSRQMTEVPLNGRNFLQLLTLVPGVSTGENLNTFQTGLIAVTRLSVSGAANDANLFSVDGAENKDPGGGNVIPSFPSIDSIEEFRVQTNAYSPQYGGAGGAQVTMLTKSGGNAFHGTAYEFLRNDQFDANSFFLNQSGKPRPKLRYNDFGYTIGGPIKPKRAFFFWSQEWRRQRRGLPRAAHVPSPAEKLGDFSENALRYNQALCYTATPNEAAVGGFVTTQGGCATYPIDPNNGQPLGFVAAGQPLDPTQATIPANELSAGGLAFTQLYPDPTVDPYSALNWIASPTTPVDTRQEAIRFDYSITSSAALMVRYTQETWANRSPSFSNAGEGQLWGDDVFPNVSSSWSSPARTLAARFTKTISTAVNTFEYSLSKGNTEISPGQGWNEFNKPARLAIPTFYPHADDTPHITYWGAAYAPLWHIAPWKNDFEVHVFKDDFSKVMKSHTFIMGGLFGYSKKNDLFGGCRCTEAGETWGASGFGSGWGGSGNSIADFLFKGMAFGFDENKTEPRAQIRYKDIEWYAGDTWRASSKLTVSYGFRWSFYRQPYTLNNNIASFVPRLWDPANAADPVDGLAFPDQNGFNRALVNNRNNMIAPRVGIVWDPSGTGRIAIRAGAGQFFARTAASGQFIDLAGNPPFNANLSGRRLLDPVNGQPFGYDFAGNVLTTSAASLGRPTKGIDPNLMNPNTWQWNTSVDVGIAKNNVLQLAYVGNRGLHIPRPVDINQVPLSSRAACVTATLANVGCAQLRPYGAGVIGNNALQIESWTGDSIYHSMQVKYTGRFQSSSQLNVAYTWSRLIGTVALSDFGDSAGQRAWLTDLSNPRYDRGLEPYDRTHNLVVNYIYDVPEMKNSGALVRGALGGWELSGVSTFSTGVPLTVFANPNIDYTGLANANLARPDVAVNSTKGPKTADQWFNVNAFTLVGHAVGTLGNASRGDIRGPGINNWDIAVMKSWNLRWIGGSWAGEKARLQFRAEMFNAFNHTQFLSVDTNFGASNIQFDDPVNPTKVVSYTTNPTFGHVTRVRDPREIQFGLKFIW